MGFPPHPRGWLSSVVYQSEQPVLPYFPEKDPFVNTVSRFRRDSGLLVPLLLQEGKSPVCLKYRYI